MGQPAVVLACLFLGLLLSPMSACPKLAQDPAVNDPIQITVTVGPSQLPGFKFVNCTHDVRLRDIKFHFNDERNDPIGPPVILHKTFSSTLSTNYHRPFRENQWYRCSGVDPSGTRRYSNPVPLVRVPRKQARKLRSSQPTFSDSQLQDCILRDINCPPSGVLDFKQARIFVRILNSLDLPERCKCDLSEIQCLRGCYYNYQVKATLMSAVWHALRQGTDVDVAKQSTVVAMETYFMPCLLQFKGCGDLQISLDPAKLSEGLANFKVLTDLSEQCQCNIEEDNCARNCFYSEAKKLIAAGFLVL